MVVNKTNKETHFLGGRYRDVKQEHSKLNLQACIRNEKARIRIYIPSLHNK